MKRTSPRQRSAITTRRPAGQKKCPYCAEWLAVRNVHICPVGCCYVPVGQESFETVCPYCGRTFETRAGHVCLELLKLTDPAQ